MGKDINEEMLGQWKARSFDEKMDILAADGKRYLEYMKKNGGLYHTIQSYLEKYPEAASGIERSWTKYSDELFLAKEKGVPFDDLNGFSLIFGQFPVVERTEECELRMGNDSLFNSEVDRRVSSVLMAEKIRSFRGSSEITFEGVPKPK